jgi:hypothetical protein
MDVDEARLKLRQIVDDAVGPVLPPEADAVLVADAVVHALVGRGSIGPITVGHGQTMMGYELPLETW